MPRDMSFGELPSPPAKHLAVVACMDARMDLHRILGLEPGEAHVIRNAGGIVTQDVLRSLAISQPALGTSELVARLRPDVVLMDVRMPQMDGIAATRLLRSKLPGVPVIALSTTEEMGPIAGMISAGASGYLRKVRRYPKSSTRSRRSQRGKSGCQPPTSCSRAIWATPSGGSTDLYLNASCGHLARHADFVRISLRREVPERSRDGPTVVRG